MNFDRSAPVFLNEDDFTLAIFINMSLANMSGVLIPLVLKRLQIDPALSGAVILTTVTDVVGFLSFLGLATLIIL